MVVLQGDDLKNVSKNVPTGRMGTKFEIAMTVRGINDIGSWQWQWVMANGKLVMAMAMGNGKWHWVMALGNGIG